MSIGPIDAKAIRKALQRLPRLAACGAGDAAAALAVSLKDDDFEVVEQWPVTSGCTIGLELVR